MKKYIVLVIVFFISFAVIAQKVTQGKGMERQGIKSNTTSTLSFLANASETFNSANPGRDKDTANRYFELALKNNDFLHAGSAARLLAKMERKNGNRQVLYYYDSIYLHYAKMTGLADTIFNALQLYSRDLMAANKLLPASSMVKEAFSIADSLNKPSLLSKAQFNLGFYSFKNSNPRQAIIHFRKSYDKAIETEDYYNAAICKIWIGYASIYTGKIDSSIALIFEAREYHEKNKNFSDIADCYESLGLAFQAYGNTEKAIAYYQRSRDLFLEENDIIKIAGQSLKLAPLYIIQKQFDSAQRYAQDAEKRYSQINYTAGIAIAKTVVGQVYSAIGDTEKAKEYFAESAELNKTEQNPLLAIYNNGYTAVNLIKEGKQAQGDSLIMQSFLKVKKILPNELIQTAYKRMRQNNPISLNDEKVSNSLLGSVLINPGEGDSAIYINPYTAAPTSMDSLIGTRYNNQLQELETKYKTRLKDDSLRIEKQNAIVARNTLKTRNYFLFTVAAVSLLLAAGLCLLYFSRKRALRDKEKIELLQNEIHHRVKNNLGVIRRLVEVAGKSMDDQVPLMSLQNRIAAIELLHKRLYQDEAAPGRILLQPYLEELVRLIRSAFQTNDNIVISIKADVDMEIDIADKLGLIINELVTNSLKYAFNDRSSGSIEIIMQHKDEYHLIVSDNGEGFDASRSYKSYGMRLIKGLSNEINGRYQFNNQQGTRFELYFKA